MQLPEPPPPPLAPLWDRVLRARALPPDLDVQLLYVAIRDRLVHPEWEVRLHALRVLADLLPLSGNALSFPFDQVVDNLGHNSPNVRKAALDALKVFCLHCEDSECAASAILDKCSYYNIRPQSANIENKVNVVTGLILSIPSVMGILKRRNPDLNLLPMFQTLGDKLLDHNHRDVAQRSLLKLRRFCGPREYMAYLSKLDRNIQDKFRLLCEIYDEDSLDVYYGPRKTYRDQNNQTLVTLNRSYSANTPVRLSTDSSSEESLGVVPYHHTSNLGKIIIETEIKFDSDTAITMTVLEENETESEKNTASEEDYDSSDRNMLKYSDGDYEDTDVVVKKVRFGGECVKIRTPDSDNIHTSEDDNNNQSNNEISEITKKDNIDEASKPSTPVIVSKMNELKREAQEREAKAKASKKSGIPLPVLHNKTNNNSTNDRQPKMKIKSKSLSELYEYFKSKNGNENVDKQKSLGFALNLAELKPSDKLPSPVEPHREVEVLHNLQRSPVISPRRQRKHVFIEQDGFVLNLLACSPPLETEFLSPRAPSPLRQHYAWEDLDVVPRYVVDQLHNTENWISAVKAADYLHSTFLDVSNVRRVETAALSLVQHMWALSDAVPAARAPTEGAVCALFRSASNSCARLLLPALVSRLATTPPPAALPQALLQRLALHNLVDLIFDPDMIGVSGEADRVQDAQLRATLCLARAAGPAAVLAAVRRRLAGTSRAVQFCNKLRERLNRPIDSSMKYAHVARSSQLPVAVRRRRARSTPTPPAPQPPRRLRPLPDSAPLPGVSSAGKQLLLHPLTPIPYSDKDRDSNNVSAASVKKDPDKVLKADNYIIAAPTTDVDVPDDALQQTPPTSPPAPPRSPSIKVEDYSEISVCEADSIPNSPEKSFEDGKTDSENKEPATTESQSIDAESQKAMSLESQRSVFSDSPKAGHGVSNLDDSEVKDFGEKVEEISVDPISRMGSLAGASAGSLSPEPMAAVQRDTRDVRRALAECALPPAHERWEQVVAGLAETARLASDPGASAPATAWRAATRAAAAHVRSLRSRVAREACGAVGALFAQRGAALEPELDEAVAALLDRCADVNRFLRADAAEALACVALGCGGGIRAAGALARRGAGHRAGAARAAAAAALARLVAVRGPRLLAAGGEARAALLRAAGELLGDAHAGCRRAARALCRELATDARFPKLLREAMAPSRYRAIEKLLDKIHDP